MFITITFLPSWISLFYRFLSLLLFGFAFVLWGFSNVDFFFWSVLYWLTAGDFLFWPVLMVDFVGVLAASPNGIFFLGVSGAYATSSISKFIDLAFLGLFFGLVLFGEFWLFGEVMVSKGFLWISSLALAFDSLSYLLILSFYSATSLKILLSSLSRSVLSLNFLAFFLILSAYFLAFSPRLGSYELKSYGLA